MPQKNTVYAVMKIGAVIILFNFLQSVPTSLQVLWNDVAYAPLGAVIAALAIHVFTLLLAATMWFFPVTIARRLGLWEAEPDFDPARDSWLETSLLSVIGLYLVALALSDLAYYWGLHSSITTRFDEIVPPESFGGITASVAQLVLGIILTLGARHIPLMLRRVRGA